MAQNNLKPVLDEHPVFPYDPESIDKLCLSGDENTLRQCSLGRKWTAEWCSGKFRTWDDLKTMKDYWDGPIILKGIQSVLVSISTRRY
jgi:lactate 2-monooxygenase